MLQQGGVLTELDANYRSTAAVVDAYNQLVRRGADGPFFTGGIDYERPVRSESGVVAVDGGGAETAPVHVFAVGDPGNRKQPIDDLRRALAERIGREIRDLLAGEVDVRIGRPGQTRQAR